MQERRSAWRCGCCASADSARISTLQPAYCYDCVDGMLRSAPVRCPDTGLTPTEQQARQQAAATWAHRLLALMETTGCSAADALRAIEEADRQQDW